MDECSEKASEGFVEFWDGLGIKAYCVYRAYDAQDRLLYVGFTQGLRARMRNHYQDSEWCQFTERLEFDYGYTEKEARAEETKQIQKLKPLHNKAMVQGCGRQGPREKIGAHDRRNIVLVVLEGAPQISTAVEYGLDPGHISRLVKEARTEPSRKLLRANAALDDAKEEVEFRRKVVKLLKANERQGETK